jgi:WD40 repeat protein/transcriptional regulator with XRE-family HTH domain
MRGAQMLGQGRTGRSRFRIDARDCGARPARARHLRLMGENEAFSGGGADPDLIETAAQFGRALQALRDRSGLTIREVARQADGRVATVGDYFSGRHLPLDRELLARLLAVLGVEHPALVERWQLALARVRRQPGRRSAPPYRGLARFEASDAQRFFGREDVISLLCARATAPAGLPLLLVGPSGAGKSSVLRAGLVPRLSGQPGGPTAVYDVTVTGVGELADQVTRLAAEPQRPAVIVDQFEAVFTGGDEEEERGRLVGALCQLARGSLVVLALRADFYAQAVRYPGLAQALQDRHVVLGPMTAEQVRDAVVRPARSVQSDVDEGLVTLLLADLAPAGAKPEGGHGDAAYEPGALPLLSHALLATWERSRGQALTVNDYLASGGIRDALTRTAERAYESLDDGQRALARQLFLRLVHVSRDSAPSRAAVALADLPGDAELVLATFVGERMITVDADAARITHDALLTTWPRLRAWIEDDTGQLRDRGQIVAAAQSWAAADQEEAALWRGQRLALAREWAADAARRALLPGQALSFLDACVAAAGADERAARRRTRRLQATVAVLTVLVLAVAGLSGYAFSQRSAADTATSAANSRAVAFAAEELRDSDPGTAAQLSVSADAFALTTQSTAALLESSGAASVARIDDSAGIVQWTALSPDRRLLAAAGDDGTLRLWDVTRPGRPTLITDLVAAHSQVPLYAAAFSPDGKVLAAAGVGGVIRLWTVSGSKLTAAGRLPDGVGGTVFSLAFSPDSGTLAAGSSNGTVRLWRVTDPVRPATDGAPLAVAGTYPNSVAFSPDGRTLAAGTEAGTVLLWRVPAAARLAAGSAPAPLAGTPLHGPEDNVVTGVAFSPDGQELAAASKDGNVYLWRLPGGRAVADGKLTGATNWVNTVAFSPDGRSVAAGTSDASVLVWDLATKTLSATMAHPQPVTGVTWDGSGRVVAAGADGTVSLWSLPGDVIDTGYKPTELAYSQDGATLAVAGNGSVQLWDARSHALLASRALPAGAFANAIAFRPAKAGAALVAVAVSDGTVELLDGRTLAPVTAPVKVTVGLGQAESLAFSPDGALLATGADDGTTRLYDVTSPARPRAVAIVSGKGQGTPIYTVAFSPDGSLVAASSGNNDVQLWRVTSAHGLAVAGPDLGGMASYPIGLAFSPDSQTLAIGNADKHAYLWNVGHPAQPRRLSTLSGPTSNVWSVAFSPDGKTLAAGVNDGTVWLWNTASPARPALTATISGLPGHVFSLAFSPDGRQLAAASFDDDTVRLWDTSAAAARAEVCANLGQPLTEAEWQSHVPGVPYRQPCS